MAVGFLPYGGGATGLWSGSFVMSISAHVVITAGIYALYTTAPPPEPLEERANFTVTLEQLDTDVLAGTVQDDPVPLDADGDGDGGEGDDYEDADDVEPVELAALDDAESIDPETPETVEADTPEAVETAEDTETPDETEADSVDQLDPEEVETAALDSVEAVEPDIPEAFQDAETIEVPDAIGTLEGVVPDGATAVAIDQGAVAALDSTIVDSVAPVAPSSPVAAIEDVSPIAPITETSPLTPDIAAPVAGDSGGLSPVAGDGGGLAPVTNEPVAIASVANSGPTTVTSVAPNLGQLAPVAPLTTETETVAAVSTPLADTQLSTPRPQPTSAAAPSAQDLALGQLIGRIRATPAEERCLIALPRRDGPDGIGLSIIAASETAMEAYAQSLLTNDDSEIRQTRTLIDQRQCAALSYIRANEDYPATRMGIVADVTDVESGENFSGVLRGAAGRYLTLLVIDDNGVVQDLQRFMSFSSNLARFDAPVNRSGPARDTKQILLAVATRRAPTEIRERIGRVSADVFGGLPVDLTTDAALGVLTFDVR